MMLASLVVGTVLVLPSCLAVARLTNGTLVGFLVRGSLERAAVLGAAMLGAVAIFAQIALFAAAFDGDRWSDAVGSGMTFFAPALLGATPWVAGEVLSGPSVHRTGSLAASLAAAYATNWSFYALVWPADAGPAVAGLLFIAAAAGVATAGISAWCYLAVRGPALEIGNHRVRTGPVEAPELVVQGIQPVDAQPCDRTVVAALP